jgi:hypothetical protein
MPQFPALDCRESKQRLPCATKKRGRGREWSIVSPTSANKFAVGLNFLTQTSGTEAGSELAPQRNPHRPHEGFAFWCKLSCLQNRLPSQRPSCCEEASQKMSATARRKELRPLCFEHHAEMKLGIDGRRSLFFCDVPRCTISYGSSRGYVISLSAIQSETQILPHVTCPDDGSSMYLAEIKRENPSFRLWKCPVCDRILSNEDGLGS